MKKKKLIKEANKLLDRAEELVTLIFDGIEKNKEPSHQPTEFFYMGYTISKEYGNTFSVRDGLDILIDKVDSLKGSKEFIDEYLEERAQ